MHDHAQHHHIFTPDPPRPRLTSSWVCTTSLSEDEAALLTPTCCSRLLSPESRNMNYSEHRFPHTTQAKELADERSEWSNMPFLWELTLLDTQTHTLYKWRVFKTKMRPLTPTKSSSRFERPTFKEVRLPLASPKYRAWGPSCFPGSEECLADESATVPRKHLAFSYAPG